MSYTSESLCGCWRPNSGGIYSTFITPLAPTTSNRYLEFGTGAKETRLATKAKKTVSCFTPNPMLASLCCLPEHSVIYSTERKGLLDFNIGDVMKRHLTKSLYQRLVLSGFNKHSRWRELKQLLDVPMHPEMQADSIQKSGLEVGLSIL